METQQGFTLWLTGMSGAGKSALATYLVKRLPLVGRRVELLDPSELGALAPDAPNAGRDERDRTVRLLGWVSKLLTRNGTIPVVAAISPHREVRDEQRRQIGRFFEVMVECPFEILMERDTKGIYRRALAGEIEDVVGVQTPYEPPHQPEAVVDMARGDVEAAAAEIFEKLAAHGYITRHERDVLVNGSAPAETAAPKAKSGKGKAAAAKEAKAAAKEARSAPAKEGKAMPAKGAAAKPAPAASKAPAKGTKPAAMQMKPEPKAKAPAKASKPAAKAKAPAKVAKPAAKAKSAPAKKTAAAKPAKAAPAKAAAKKPAPGKSAPAKAKASSSGKVRAAR